MPIWVRKARKAKLGCAPRQLFLSFERIKNMRMTDDPSGGAAQRGAERRYLACVRIGVPRKGLGRQLEITYASFDEICGAEGWAVAPAGTTGIVDDAPVLHFVDAAFASLCFALLLWL
jgi:hypothetical protein